MGGALNYLFYKDTDTVERFVEEITVANRERDLVPILHRFGAYWKHFLARSICVRYSRIIRSSRQSNTLLLPQYRERLSKKNIEICRRTYQHNEQRRHPDACEREPQVKFPIDIH